MLKLPNRTKNTSKSGNMLKLWPMFSTCLATKYEKIGHDVCQRVFSSFGNKHIDSFVVLSTNNHFSHRVYTVPHTYRRTFGSMSQTESNSLSTKQPQLDTTDTFSRRITRLQRQSFHSPWSRFLSLFAANIIVRWDGGFGLGSSFLVGFLVLLPFSLFPRILSLRGIFPCFHPASSRSSSPSKYQPCIRGFLI